LHIDLAEVDEQITALRTEIAIKSAHGDTAFLDKAQNDLLVLLHKRELAEKNRSDFSAELAALRAELAALSAAASGISHAIISESSGYFYSYTDGYESVLNVNQTDKLTADQIKEIISNERIIRESRSSSEIGKLVKGYNWKIAGIIDNSNSVYNAGDTVKLSFASTPDTVSAVIESLEPTDDPQEWSLILRCDEMTFDLVSKRIERVEMTLNDFEGIKIPREAIRFNKNNEKGCYVLWGQRVLFKKADIIFEDEDYILSRITADEDYVCVYDDIIIKGVDTAAYRANSEKDSVPESDAEVSDSEVTEAAEETTLVSEETVSETETSEDETEAVTESEGDVQNE
jgi:hypothetical protein